MIEAIGGGAGFYLGSIAVRFVFLINPPVPPWVLVRLAQ
jgi:hypothetical protein